MNKKVRNATPVVYNGIKFRSTLERRIYQYLVENHIDVFYETKRITIWERHTPFSVPYFDKVGRKFKRVTGIPLDVHYTPDFILSYKGYFIYLEAKGFKNDVTPYKIRMFREWLEYQSLRDNIHYVYAVVYSIKDVKTLLKELDNENII